MTNYEWLKMQPVELIVHAIAVEGCQCCIKKEICNGNVNAIECETGVLLWLQQEHIEEPKMVDANEIIKGIERAKYCDAKYCELAYTTVCNGADKCINAIKNYIKAMEGVENETV